MVVREEGSVQHRFASAASFDDWDGVHDAVAQAYFPHLLQPLSAGPPSRSALELVDLGPCRVTRMALGATVAIRSDHPGAYAINAPLRGAFESRIGSASILSEVGQATVCPPDTPTHLPAWEPSCLLLGFRADSDFLEREYERVLARRPRPVSDQLDLNTDDGQDWLGLVQSTFDQVRGGHAGLMQDPRMAQQMSALLITGLLLAITPDERTDKIGTRPRIVRRVIEALEQDPGRAWTPPDMAELAGVSVRRLQQGFREYVGQTPFQYLHDLRMERAHHDLITADDNDTVTDIALRWGLLHTSRFAAEYRRRYGRSPSAALADR